jgi:hypothetical protein
MGTGILFSSFLTALLCCESPGLMCVEMRAKFEDKTAEMLRPDEMPPAC